MSVVEAVIGEEFGIRIVIQVAPLALGEAVGEGLWWGKC